MFKAVKRPKNYIAIKVPEDCEDVGKYVSNKFKENSIPIRVNFLYGHDIFTTFGEGENQFFVKQGDVIVAVYSELCGYSVRVMSQEEFDNLFKPDDEPAKSIKAEMSTKIEGVKLPDHPRFSESFIAELDKALNDYQQKHEQSSQRASTPHVRIEFDDINDVPHVWIDGKYISSFPAHGLVKLNIDWNADDEHVNPKHYNIDYRNGEYES